MRRLLLALVLLATMLPPFPAGAQDAEGDQGVSGGLGSAFSNLDQQFDTWVVTPFDAVLFFDVVFWDDTAAALRDRCHHAGIRGGVCDALLDVPRAERPAVCAERSSLSKQECHDVLAGVQLPFIVLWLVAGALFFTFRFRFINLRAFVHALRVTRGTYDDPSQPGEVSHFQALSSALSATVGLGNIAGVAVAVGMGGPGAVVWMIVGGFLGMSSKFTECTLGQLYREVDPQGRVSGGPMRYLEKGLGQLGGARMHAFGKALAVLFSGMCILASFGGGNMFQANQAYAQVSKVLPVLEGPGGAMTFGILLAVFVGVVIIGGIRRIGTVAGYIVPFMCFVYIAAGLFIVVTHAAQVPDALSHILTQAVTPEAGFGGLAGVLVQGFRRSAFSNEAGIGSAPIAHSAAATDEPVREGIVALLEPFIDTLVVCTTTALVVVISGAYKEPGEGVVMTSNAFGSVLPWFPSVLSFAVLMFAFSTMISWSYYGERCWAYLFGSGSSMIYRSLFLLFIVLGSILQLGSVVDFSDLMILGMAFPNILGLVLLSGRAGEALDDYWGRFKAGRM